MSDTAKLFALIDREAAAATNLKQAQDSYKEDNFQDTLLALNQKQWIKLDFYHSCKCKTIDHLHRQLLDNPMKRAEYTHTYDGYDIHHDKYELIFKAICEEINSFNELYCAVYSKVGYTSVITVKALKYYKR